MSATVLNVHLIKAWMPVKIRWFSIVWAHESSVTNSKKKDLALKSTITVQ